MSFIKKLKTPYSILFLLLILVVPTFMLVKNATNNPGVAKAAAPTLHYLYVFPDGAIDIYDMDHGHRLVKQISLPIFKGGRGCVVDPASHMLYLSYNGDGGPHGNGSLLKYDLVANKIVWTVNYPFGIDSPAITPDGKTIYMPDGESSYDGTWHVLNASNGSVKGTIFIGVGAAAHNTIINLSGTHVYMGALNWPYLVEADTITNKIIKQIGPLLPGVRPFTINKEETLAFTTASKVLGFQVSNINTGKVLYTVPVKGYSAPASAPVPSHGITLSPDQKEIYLIDTANSKAHVFDVSGLPKVAPRQVADIPLRTMIGTETPCAYDCTHEGWILHSLDGHYVYVGDSGDVIDTRARKVVANLAPLFNTRKYLEIDWSNGVPVATSTRHGLGYA